MQDRVPLYPGRVKLTPVAGQENTYDMVRADQPTQVGTPLNKDSLLKDATAALYGLGADAVPDDVLAKIHGLLSSVEGIANSKAKIVVGSYVGNGSYGSSNPNSISFESVPDFFCVLCRLFNGILYRRGIYGGSFEFPKTMSTEFKPGRGVTPSGVDRYDSTSYGKCQDNKISWYNTTDAEQQFNSNGVSYQYIAIWM